MTPQSYAREVRELLGLGWGPIEPQQVCETLGIRVFEEDLGPNEEAAGALVLSPGGRLGIVVNQNTLYTPRKRFTIAHELGHACIRPHADPDKWCSAGEIDTYRSDKKVEREANEFASELLLPERTMKERLKRFALSMNMFTTLAEEFGTSLTATACRVVSLAEFDRCALVLSTAERIKWVFVSPAFRSSVKTWGKGDELPPFSHAYAALRGDVAPGARPVPAAVWLTSQAEGIDFVWEDAMLFSNLGQVLSFLEVPLSGGEVG